MDSVILVQDGARTLIRNPRARRLGSLFVPARRLYLFVFPVALGLAGAACVIAETDWMMIVGAFVATAISVFLALDILARDAPVRLSTVLAFTLGLGYGLGTLNTWITLPRGGESLGDFLGVSTPDLAQAMGGLLLAMALLLGLGELYEKAIFGEDFRLKFNNRSILLLSIGTAFRAGMIVSGHAGGFGNVTVTDFVSGRAGALILLADDLQNPLFALSLCAAVNAHTRVTRIYLWCMTAVLFLTAFPLGRREMIYSILLGVLGLRFGNYRLKASTFKKLIYTCVLTAFLYFATIVFFYFRIAGYTLINPTMPQRVRAVIHLAETQKYSDIKEKFSANVEQRTFIIGFLAELVGYTDTMSGGHGHDLLSEMQLALPSVLYPGKDLFYTEEQYANSLFGSEYGDQANSVLTTGTVDFGFLGMLVYPLLMVFIMRTFLEFCGDYLPPFAASFAIFLVIGTMLEPEIDMTAYFVDIRDGLLVAVAVSLLQQIPEFRLRDTSL